MTMSVRERHRISVVAAIAVVATSVSLTVCMQRSGYLVWVTLGVVGIAVLGIALRQARVPMPLVGVVQLVAATVGLLNAFDIPLSFGVIPTDDTWVVARDILQEASAVARTFSAPAPYSAGLALLLSALVLLVAICVDQLAGGLGRVPVAGLPLLALYSVPAAAVDGGTPAWGFVPGAAAYTALLVTAQLGRISRWGRVVDRDGNVAASDGALTSGAMSRSAVQIAVVAIAVAVAGAWAVPTLPAPWSSGGSGPGSGRGGDISFSNPLVSLSEDLQERVPEPLVTIRRGSPSYVRLAVLDEPGPQGWRVSTIELDAAVDPRDTVPLPPGTDADAVGEERDVRIRLLDGFPKDSPWLPVPYLPRRTSLSDDFGYLTEPGTISAMGSGISERLPRPFDYDAVYADVNVSAEDLRADGTVPPEIAARYLSVPVEVPYDVTQQAQVATGGVTDPYMKARMLETYFHDESRFTYDIDAEYGYGYGAMARFLDDGRGFCQHFAATMAMMARAEGIPSRVVVGFLHGERNRDGSTTYWTRDLHAWPELYFPGTGWVRFEPTPGNGATVPPYAPLVSDSFNPNEGQTNTTSSETPSSSRPTPTGTASAPTTQAPERPTPRPAADGWTVPWWVPAIVAGLVLLLVPCLVRIGQRRRRLGSALSPAQAAEDAWWELRCQMADLALPWSGGGQPTLRERERDIRAEIGDDDVAQRLHRLVVDVERARFAEGAAGRNPADTAEDARAVEEHLTAGQGWRVRWRARLLPRSLTKRRRRETTREAPRSRSVGSRS